MLESITWIQLLEWFDYARLEPFGEERGDSRAAMICAMIANVNRDPKKKATPYSVSDFMPRYGEPRKSPASAKGRPTKSGWAAFKANVRSAYG